MLNKMTLWDKLLICSIIIINIIILIGSTFKLNSNDENKIIEIKVHGSLVEKLNVTSDAENTYNFEFGENIGYIEVKNGAVRMLEMDKEICPEKICSDTGWIKKEYESIVCLPNGVIVNIKGNGNNQNDDVDIIVS